jgi:hypothetical protein
MRRSGLSVEQRDKAVWVSIEPAVACAGSLEKERARSAIDPTPKVARYDKIKEYCNTS